MAKYKRGDVYLCLHPSGKDKSGKDILKHRPMIVLSDTETKIKLVPLIYCTTQNKSLETDYQIIVEKGSNEYLEMGLTELSYVITSKLIPNFPTEALLYKIGHCPFMDKVDSMRNDYLIYGEKAKKAS